METKISKGTKVRPVGFTKNSLSYGYVRELFDDHGGIKAYVYWPEIKSCGSWPLAALKAA